MYYPNVSVEFILDKLRNSSKIKPETEQKIGSSYSFMLAGNKAAHKNIVIFREFDGEVNFVKATDLAWQFGFMGLLLDWYRKHKGWNEGGFSDVELRKISRQDLN